MRVATAQMMDMNSVGSMRMIFGQDRMISTSAGDVPAVTFGCAPTSAMGCLLPASVAVATAIINGLPAL
jgi:hypothetical protein